MRPETLEGFQRGRCCFALSVTKDNTQIPKEFDFFFFLKSQASFVLLPFLKRFDKKPTFLFIFKGQGSVMLLQ